MEVSKPEPTATLKTEVDVGDEEIESSPKEAMPKKVSEKAEEA